MRLLLRDEHVGWNNFVLQIIKRKIVCGQPINLYSWFSLRLLFQVAANDEKFAQLEENSTATVQVWEMTSIEVHMTIEIIFIAMHDL